jgi:TAG lipase/steryl ester hydrolase/phospholipase A2/LPA acyltransferase
MDASSESDYAAEEDDSPATDSLHKSASTLDHTDDSVVHDIQEKHVVDG